MGGSPTSQTILIQRPDWHFPSLLAIPELRAFCPTGCGALPSPSAHAASSPESGRAWQSSVPGPQALSLGRSLFHRGRLHVASARLTLLSLRNGVVLARSCLVRLRPAPRGGLRRLQPLRYFSLLGHQQTPSWLVSWCPCLAHTACAAPWTRHEQGSRPEGVRCVLARNVSTDPNPSGPAHSGRMSFGSPKQLPGVACVPDPHLTLPQSQKPPFGARVGAPMADVTAPCAQHPRQGSLSRRWISAW